jgi:glycosyltransferase involved in cell wall biosynthesis
MHRTEGNEARYPMKLVNYMGCGLLVIGNDVGETKYLLADGRGVLMKGDSITKLSELIDNTIANFEKLKIKGKKSKAYVFNNLNEDVISLKLIGVMKSVKKHN